MSRLRTVAIVEYAALDELEGEHVEESRGDDIGSEIGCVHHVGSCAFDPERGAIASAERQRTRPADADHTSHLRNPLEQPVSHPDAANWIVESARKFH